LIAGSFGTPSGYEGASAVPDQRGSRIDMPRSVSSKVDASTGPWVPGDRSSSLGTQGQVFVAGVEPVASFKKLAWV
jgi:hypothetical protein